ncbi:IgD binding protein/hemagglutinin MID [Haemophilus parahaemolyticus HK385]|uniref:YadA-like family protein n=1 Tax=Haemophilus parahaemolyticus TaxID=735 RepID=UPI000DFE4EBC|nr:YadA-like family protein [Haemophilus parahaemolyticus]QRP11979.1 YadA-like family protein [Haemophilus parahaemolyticus]STO67262.1 IgD binding protein/hemagglutinin MID [Haemophilus parahaemolyticus HK385]
MSIQPRYAEVGDNGVVKFNVNTTTLSNTTANGKITVPDGNGLVTAKEVANAINAANWNLNVGGATVQNVKAGDFVSFANGNGTTVTYKDGAVRVNANVTDVVSANSNATITRDPNTGIVTVNAKDTNTQVTVANATSSPITIATTQNTNGTNNYTVDVNVDGKTITKEGGVLKAVIPSVETVTLTVNTAGNNAGKVEVPTTEADKKKLVTAENVAKAINESYWVAKRGDSVTTNADSGDGDSNVAAGNNVTFVAGKNMALQKAGNKFIYATKDDVTFNNVTANNTTTTNLTVKNGGNVDMGGNQVHNVSTGTAPTDAVNVKQLYDTVSGNVSTESVIKKADEDNIAEVTVADNKQSGDKNAKYEVSVSKAKIKALANETVKVNTSTAANNPITVTPHTENGNTTYTVNFDGTKAASEIPLTYKANDGAGKTVKLSEGLNFKNGTQTTAEVGDNGVVKFNVNTTTLSNTTANGKITVPDGNGLVTAKEVANAINAASWNLNVSGATVQNVKAGDFVSFANGNGTTVTYKDGAVRVNANVTDVVSANSNATITRDPNTGIVTVNAKDTNTQVTVANATSSPITIATTQNANGTNNYTVDVNVDGKTITKEGGVLKAVIPSVETVTLTVNTAGNNAGKVEVPTTEADKKKLVTAENVAKAINESYWVAKRGDSVTTNADSGDGDSNIAAGNNVTFIAGKNIALQKDGNKFIYATKDDVTFNNVTANNTTTTNLTVKNGGNVDMGGNQVHNVSTGTAPTDAVNVKQLYDTVSGNVSTESVIKKADEDNIAEVTVADNKQSGDKNAKYEVSVSKAKIKALANETVKVNTSTAANNPITVTPHTENGNTTYTVNFDGAKAAAEIPLTYKANDGEAKTVTLSEGLNFKNGTQTTAEVGDNGVVKFNVNTTTLSNTTANGKITVPDGNGLVTAKEVANAINAANWNLNVGGATVQNVKAGDFVSFANGNGTTVTYKDGAVRVNANVTDVVSANSNATITRDPNTGIVTVNAKDTNTQVTVANATSSPITIATTQNANGTNNYTVDVNVDGKTITKEGGVLKAVIPSVETVTLTVNTAGNNAGKVEVPTTEADKKKLVTAENVAKAINESYWVAKRGDSVTTNADSGDGDSNIAAGNNVTFIAGKNIALQKDGNKFIYATKDDVTFNNVTANNTTTTNLTVKNGGNVDMGGNQVHNVSTGTAPTDAVNVKQLYDTVSGNVSTESVIKKADEDNIAEVTVADNKQSGDKNAKYEVSVSKAKIKALANETVKVNTSTAANNPITVTPHTENGNTTYTVNFDGAKAAAEIPLTYKANDGEAKTVTLSEGLNFKNGTQTTAEVGDNGVVKFNVNTTTLSNTTANGKITVPDGNGLVTAKEVANAINAANWNLNVGGATVQNVKAGDFVSFANGNGTTVTYKDGAVRVNANVTDVVSANSNATITRDPNTGIVTVNAKDTNTQVTVANATSSPITIATTQNANGTNNYTVDVNVDGKTITKEGGVLKAVIPSVETVTLTVNTAGNNAGKVEVPTTEADKKKLVTAENVAKAINESYWVAKRGDSVTTNADSGDGDSNIAAGNNVTFIAGKNIALQKDGNKFIYATKDDVTFNNVTANNTTTTNLTVKNGGNVDMGGNQVHNVSTGTAPTDAVNVKQLYDTVSGNVSTESVIKKADEDNIAEVTVADNKQSGDKNAKYEVSVSKAKIKALANETVKVNTSTAANNPITVTPHTENGNTTYTVNFDGAKAAAEIPLTYKANDGEAKTVTLSEGLNFKNGTQTTAEVGDNGVVKFNVNTTTLSNTTANGKITVPDGNGLVTAKEVANAINAASWNLNVSGATVQNVKAGDFVSFANGNGTTVTYKDGAVRVNANVTDVVSANGNATITRDPNTGIVTVNAKDTNTQVTVANATSSPITIATTQNANGTNNYTVDVNVDGKTITKENGVLKAVIPSVETVTLTVNTAGNNAGKVEVPTTEADKKKLVTAENVAKAINESYWVAKRGDSVTTNADSGDGDSNIAAGNNVTFIAGKNIALQKDGNKFIYATKDDVTFNNVTANNTTTTNLTVKNGGNVDMGGNQVHNVSTGTAPTDAVNVKQLYDTVSGNVSTESVIKKADEDNIAEVTVADNKQSGDKNAKYEVSVSKAKIKALANETVKVNTSTAANNPITVTPHTENGNTTYTVNFDGAKAAAEIPLTYKANDGEAKTVTLSEGLNFKNGTQTTAEVGDNGVVKFNVNTTTLSNTTANGKITVPDGNGLVTAKEVANAINAANWNLNVGGATVQNVKAGDFVSFANGNGTTVTYKDGAVRVNANVTDVVSANSNATITRDPNTGIVTVNAKDTNTQASVKNGSGITVTPSTNANGTANYTVAVNVDGSTITVNNDGKLVANVPDTSKVSLTNNAGKVGDVSAEDANKLVTGDNLAKTINATYWKASQGTHEETTSEETTGAVSSEIKPGDELTFVSGKNMALKKDGNKFVYATKDDVTFNNVTTNNLTVNAKGNVDMGGNQVHNVANGTKGTDAVNLDQLNATTAIANAGWVIKANGTNATTVKPNATVSLNNTDGNILITKNTANNNVTFNFNPNATFGVVGKDGKDGVDGSIGVNGKDGASVVINGKDGSIGLTGPKGADGKDGVSLTLKPEKGTTTVNEKDANKEIERIKYTANGTTREVATLDDGLKFAGDDNAVINRTLGSLLNITGGAEKATVADNIRVTNDGKNGLKVQLSNNVTFNANGSVKVGDTTVNNGGLTITGGPSITKDGGVNAGDKVISNVSTGVKDNDAVNVKQLKDTVADSVSTESVIKKADEDNIAEVTVADNKQSGDKNAKYEVSVSKAKIKALANETVKVNTSTAANNPITVTSHTENGNTTYSVNFNGENASKVIPLSYKANDGEAKTVTLSEGLNFKNGTQTTAEVGDNGVVKFNVNTTALSNVTNNGKITVPEGNGLVTAKEVAEAINASYWKANAGGNVDGATVADNVTTGTEVFFAAGKNLKVKHSANNFTFSTADDVSFNNVTTNNLTVKNGGNVDMGGNQVHNVANGTKGTDAVNLDQLNATTATANAGWVIKANGTNATTVKPNATVSLNNTDGNILITKNTANNNVTFNFNPNATFGVVGKDGKDGVDGSIGVNGKDGASVVINGKDGSIGLTGPKGADGKDGVSVTLKPEKGTTTVNAKDDGKEIERIKYTANGTTREVATLDDGLKFKGDSKQVINRTLGSQMNITGGADETTLTDNNIGVVYDKATDGLKVKLAKDVNLTSNGSVTIGNTTLNNNGFTITNKADPSKTVSVTDKGLNNGGNTIINVAPGVNGTDAVNLDQLNTTTAIANAGWVIKANGTNATTVKPNATVSLNNTDGNILITKNTANNDVTFNLNPNTTFGVKGKDGVDGSIGVNGKDGSSVVINGKDGSIGLNGKDGKNGLSIKGDQGPAGVDGKDGETKTRIVYEYADPKDPNKTIRENVATLNDGLRFTGNNGVENAHRLNTLVTIVGEGVDKAASANFTSASGNINVKADGKGTLEVQLAKNLKNIETINNGNSTITLNKDGGTTISGGDVSVDGNKVTNVKDGDVSANSKDAVNGSQLYHVMTNATAGWNLSVNNGKDKGNVKPGAQVDLNNTDGNIIISKTANNVTFNFNPNATFGVKGKDGKDGIDGSIGVNGKDGASVVINGKDGSIGLTGPKGADGKDGASANMSVQKGTTTVNTDRDGGKEVTRIVYTDKDKDGKDIKREVATLDDGLKFKGDSEQVINRTLGSQMNITGGADSTKLTDNNIGVVYDEATNGLKVKLSKDVDLGKDGSITIGGTQVTNNGLTIKNGPSVTEKGVDAGNKKVTNVADGDINETSKDAVNGSQLYQAVNNINKNVNAAKTELEEGDNVTITSRVGNNGQTIYKVSSTDNSAHVQGGSDAVSVTKAETTRKDGSTTVTDYTVDLSSKTKDDIKKGVDAHDTVTNKGLTFNADKGTTGAKKLGSQVAVNGDNKNIETVADTNGVKVKLKDDINVNSVTANTFKAGDTIVNTKGVQVAAKDDRGNNTNVVINEKGINAGNTRIQNVAAGRADTDAVNVSQLKGAVTQIGNHINKMDKNLRAGVAGAMAAGGLYHATLPGKSMVAAGAGTYKGESAVAVGYSRLSDNGKVGIKFSVNTNTRGDAGAAASVGYQW